MPAHELDRKSALASAYLGLTFFTHDNTKNILYRPVHISIASGFYSGSKLTAEPNGYSYASRYDLKRYRR
jgi:hypothetical protein